MRDLFERFGAVGRGVGREPPRPNELGQATAGCRVVFDDEHTFSRMRVGHFF